MKLILSFHFERKPNHNEKNWQRHQKIPGKTESNPHLLPFRVSKISLFAENANLLAKRSQLLLQNILMTSLLLLFIIIIKHLFGLKGNLVVAQNQLKKNWK